MSHSSLDLIMDYHLKRTRELKEVDKLTDPLGNATKKQKYEGKTRMINNDDDDTEESGHQPQLVVDSVLKHICVKSLIKEKRRTTEARLEINRLRARELRKRKKMMIEYTWKQINSLTTKNDNLRRKNQLQQQEITLLRKRSQLLLSNHRPLTHTSISPTSIRNSEILNILSGVGNTSDSLSDILRAPPRQPGNIDFNASTFLHHPSTIDLGHRTLQSNTYPFGA